MEERSIIQAVAAAAAAAAASPAQCGWKCGLRLRHGDARQLPVLVDAATLSADCVPELPYPAIVTPSLSSYTVPGFISMHWMAATWSTDRPTDRYIARSLCLRLGRCRTRPGRRACTAAAFIPASYATTIKSFFYCYPASTIARSVLSCWLCLLKRRTGTQNTRVSRRLYHSVFSIAWAIKIIACNHSCIHYSLSSLCLSIAFIFIA